MSHLLIEPTLSLSSDQSICESEILFRVEQFVEQVRTKTIFNPDEFKQQLIEHLTLFTEVYKPDLYYSARLQLFAKIRLQVNRAINFGDYDILEYADAPSIDNLRALFDQDTNAIKQECIKRRNNCQGNAIALENYLNLLLRHYSKLMVVRVDLKYRQDAQHLINIFQFKKDTKSLCKAMGQNRKCFVNLQGFIWTMEQGDEDGHYHIHLLLLYDANCHQSDYCTGKAVGELWEQMTLGRGTYFNCNDSIYKDRLTQRKHCGLGRIKRDDSAAQDNVRAMAQYLVKDSQHLRVKGTSGMRTFGKGSFDCKSRRGIENTLYELSKDLSSDIPDDPLVHEF